MLYRSAAILTDLDGTLFNSRGLVSEEDRAAIRAFTDGGGVFAVATGREPGNAKRLLPDLPLNGPSIVLNGAAIYDFLRGHYLHTITMDKEAARDVAAWCSHLGLPLDIQIYTPEGIFYASPPETADPEFLRIHLPALFLPLEELENKDWFKILLLEREAGALASMRDYLKQKGYEERINLVEGTTDVVKVGKYQELLPPHVDKGSCFSVLRRLPVYRGRRLFAVGDYWNDMELLRAADVACAPDNAIEEVKAVCGHILSSNNDGAIADLIRRVIPALE